MEPIKKKKGRPPANKPAEKAAPSIKFSPDVDRLLTAQAKKLKVSKIKYANAAVAYFAESGMDPTKERPLGLASISSKVSEETLKIREQNVEHGHRLISIIRGWEKNLYGFMQQQQLSTNTYLELIESNILRHQVLVESNLLAPMVEQVVTAKTEARLARVVGEHSHLKIMGLPLTDLAWVTDDHDEVRDRDVTEQMRKHMEINPVPVPKPTMKPAITPVPPKPVATVPATPPVTPTAAKS